ncbi:MAG: hypothetical protein IJY82_06790 [Oscillospiraceae bacterium]|nr:hypothetical protein [Oscillospiraceae bacterium]
MRVRQIFLIVAVAVLFLHCSCMKEVGTMKRKLSPTDCNFLTLTSCTYDELQLKEIIMFTGSFDELDKQFPVECLREENDGYFRAAYRGENTVLMVYFDEYGNKEGYGLLYGAKRMKSDFQKLKKGDSIGKVEEMDPDGEYLFMYTERNDLPRESTHCTKDGFLITIEYGGVHSHIVENIREELI